MTNRIAKFENKITVNVNDPSEDVLDDPSLWAASFAPPAPKPYHPGITDRERRLLWENDPRIEGEIHRLTRHKTCPLCRIQMFEFPADFQSGIILLCKRCGYWGGRGTREFGMGPHDRRGVIGRYKRLPALNEADFKSLVTQFVRDRGSMLQMSPARAERFAVDLISEALSCETVPLGGTKDGGVDGYIVRGDRLETIIQVKWRQSTKGSEAVRVVREVAGTLVARGVPAGILVSTRQQFSATAKAEADVISTRRIDGIGRLSLTLMDYNNLLGMLEIANVNLTQSISPEDWLPFTQDADDCVFDRGVLDRSFDETRYIIEDDS